jgi:hypothetical protein
LTKFVKKTLNLPSKTLYLRESDPVVLERAPGKLARMRRAAGRDDGAGSGSGKPGKKKRVISTKRSS